MAVAAATAAGWGAGVPPEGLAAAYGGDGGSLCTDRTADTAIPSPAFQTLVAGGVDDCAMLCARVPRCHNFQFDASASQCDLYDRYVSRGERANGRRCVCV